MKITKKSLLRILGIALMTWTLGFMGIPMALALCDGLIGLIKRGLSAEDFHNIRLAFAFLVWVICPFLLGAWIFSRSDRM